MSNKYRKQRRAKRYVPKITKQLPMLVKADITMRPLEDVIDRIERECVLDVARIHAGCESAVFKASLDGVWYELAGAIEGIVWMFELWAERNEKVAPVEPLKVLIKRLQFDMPITQIEVDAVRAVMPKLRRIATFIDPYEAADIVRTTQIRAELEHAA